MPRIRKSQNQPTISRTVWRIAVYIRLSKDDGNDESLSVTNQRKIITEYIEEFFEGEYIIVDVYADGPVKIGLNQKHPTARGALV